MTPIVLAVLAAPVLLGGSVWLANRLAPAASARFLVQWHRRAAGLVDKRLSLNGFGIAYSEGGDGEPLVLLHGLGADRGTFDEVARFLTNRYRVIIPDLLGFGDSDKPLDADYGIDAQAERLDHFLAALGLERIHLGGNSMGGWIAAAYAARYPGKVASLWLLAAAGTEDLQGSILVKSKEEHGVYMLFARSPEEFRAVLARLVYRLPPLPYCIVWAGGRRAAANYPLHTRIFDDLRARVREFQLEPRLPRVVAPTLLVWGDRDQVVPVSTMRTFHRLLPNSRAILLADVGHVPQMEAARRVAEDYLRFRVDLGKPSTPD